MSHDTDIDNDNDNGDIDLLHLHAIRIGKEASHAQPQHAYADQGRVVCLQKETRCGTCLYSRAGKAGANCSKGKKYGMRCELYRIAKK
ncbi:MAG TPA: hypothetical protein VNW52_13070 [Burkholderiaceae bacterium]|jgi:hypothetical protein|nr:hypothetical protein [Burkholderiaceae bacterium]